MTRLPRSNVPGQPQHIIQRGNNRSLMFADMSDHAVFSDCLDQVTQRHGVHLHAYVFMSNHVHLIMTPSTANGIGKVMQSVGRRYVHYFNRRHGRTGTLWEGRYRATLIDTERYLLACYRYVELNPIRAGLVAYPRQYHWSSYRSNALGQADPLITPHERYQALGTSAESRRAAYRALFRRALDDGMLADIRGATNKAWPLVPLSGVKGSTQIDRRLQPRSRGGDRRTIRV